MVANLPEQFYIEDDNPLLFSTIKKTKMNNYNKALTLIFILIQLISTAANSQTTAITTAVPFLLISPSPEANGQGCTSVSRISDDPYAIYFNPAHLGLSSTQSNAMFSFYPSKTMWLPGLGLNDLTYNALVLCGGTNLEEYLSIPLSVGVAYTRVDLNLGTFNRTSSTGPQIVGTFNGEEHNDAFSLGVGLDIGVKLAMGITFRRVESNLGNSGAGQEQGSGSASAWSRDYGFIINVPIVDLTCKKSELMTGIAPIFDLSFGSALTNVGGKMTYIDKAQADPLPRNISIGTTLEIGFKFTRTDHKLLSFTWSRQSDNLLVGRDNLGSFYREGYGDVDFFKNLVQGKRTETIDLSQGWQIGFAEILYIRGGSFVGTGNRSFTTEGLGLRLSGIFKLLQDIEAEKSSELLYIVEHFDIRYDQSDYETTETGHPLDNTEFSSLSIIVKL
jgi:hypothetical protein